MIFKFAFCSLLAFVLAAPAAPAVRKCMPEQWEAVTISKIGSLIALQTSKYSYDYQNQREARHREERLGSETRRESVITDYRKNTTYIFFNHELRQCTKLRTEFSPVQLCTDTHTPVSSLSLREETVDVYEMEQALFGWKVKATKFVYKDTLLPVTEIVEQEVLQTQHMSVLQFGNTTLGILNESVFDVPSYCDIN